MKTINPLAKSLRHFTMAASAFAVLTLTSNVFADILEVQNSNITAGNYTLSLAPTDASLGLYGLGGTGAGFIENNNFQYTFNGGHPAIVAEVGTSAADLVLGFDFSSTAYRPTDLHLTWNPINGPMNYTLSYSTDDFTWTPFSTGTYGYAQVPLAPTSTDISGLPDDVFVKIALTPGTGSTFGYFNAAIGYSYGTDTSLAYSFDVASVPEPSAVLLFGMAVAVIAFQQVRRSKDRVA